MASNINGSNPTTGSPTTESVRVNFQAARDEINRELRNSTDSVTATGTVNALVATYTYPVVKSEGVRVIVKPTGANTGAVTLNVNSTGVSSVVSQTGSALSAGQISGSSHYLDLMWDATSSYWVLLNPNPAASVATAITSDGNTPSLSTNISAQEIRTLIGSVGFLDIYPVGCIYTTVTAGNPSALFGGTWVAFGAGKVLVGVNSSETEFTPVEHTGGVKEVTLTELQIPEHSHSYTLEDPSGTSSSNGSGNGNSSFSTPETGTTGGGQAHTNLQPYIVVYMWKRTEA